MLKKEFYKKIAEISELVVQANMCSTDNFTFNIVGHVRMLELRSADSKNTVVFNENIYYQGRLSKEKELNSTLDAWIKKLQNEIGVN